MCIREYKEGSSSDVSLLERDKIMANMESDCNRKAGRLWHAQNSYNMAVRMELRRRGLPVERVHGKIYARRLK